MPLIRRPHVDCRRSPQINRVRQAHDSGTVQLFTADPQIWPVKELPASRTAGGSKKDFRNGPTQWVGKPLPDESVAIFKTALRSAKLKFPTAHDSYLINLASPEKAVPPVDRSLCR